MARVRFAIIALLVAAAPLSAQDAQQSATLWPEPLPALTSIGVAEGQPAAQPALGPTFDALSAAVRAPAPAQTTMTLAPRKSLGQAKAMMIVGGAAFVVGAIIGDDAGTIVMIGGAAVGLVGLYKYLE